MNAREHIYLFILFVQQILEISNFGLQGAHSFLQRLGVSTGEGTATELVAGFAFEADIGALCTTGTDAVATDLLASATITGLGDTTLRAVPDLDHFHRENSRHVGWMLWRICLGTGSDWHRTLGSNSTVHSRTFSTIVDANAFGSPVKMGLENLGETLRVRRKVEMAE